MTLQDVVDAVSRLPPKYQRFKQTLNLTDGEKAFDLITALYYEYRGIYIPLDSGLAVRVEAGLRLGIPERIQYQVHNADWIVYLKLVEVIDGRPGAKSRGTGEAVTGGNA